MSSQDPRDVIQKEIQIFFSNIRKCVVNVLDSGFDNSSGNCFSKGFV